MNAKESIEANYLPNDKTKEEKRKLNLEAVELKLRHLEIKTRQQELKKQEKKKKMKESSPAPLKERKEIRKEVCLNNYNNKKGDCQKSTKDISEEHVFVPPTLDEVQAYMDEIGERRFSALKFWNYYEAKGWVLGKSKMRFWKRVMDNWANKENDKSNRRRGANTTSSHQNTVVFHPYKPVDTTGAISLVEYEQLKREGKI